MINFRVFKRFSYNTLTNMLNHDSLLIPYIHEGKMSDDINDCMIETCEIYTNFPIYNIIINDIYTKLREIDGVSVRGDVRTICDECFYFTITVCRREFTFGMHVSINMNDELIAIDCTTPTTFEFHKYRIELIDYNNNFVYDIIRDMLIVSGAKL